MVDPEVAVVDVVVDGYEAGVVVVVAEVFFWVGEDAIAPADYYIAIVLWRHYYVVEIGVNW